MKPLWLSVMIGCAAASAAAGPLDGKDYVIEITSSQYVSGYARDLVPPLVEAFAEAGMHPVAHPGGDVVVNVISEADVGQWMGSGENQAWTYTVEITVGISPAGDRISETQQPAFGVRARLRTPDRDREDELACLIKLAARTALANYEENAGVFLTDGSSCLRQE